jgi:hypothetical protein
MYVLVPRYKLYPPAIATKLRRHCWTTCVLSGPCAAVAAAALSASTLRRSRPTVDSALRRLNMQWVSLLAGVLLALLSTHTCAAEPLHLGAADARPVLPLTEGQLGTTPKPPPGNVSAVEELLDRVLPGAREHFQLAIDSSACSSAGCFTLEDGSDGTIKVTGSSASDVSAGVGSYLMDHANMTIGWPRGGGQNLVMPKSWPKLGRKLAKQRNTPWSYIMNVCTHSYSLVWYSWQDWEAFIDWQALWGINLNLAMTGQEEVQWKVFTQLGLNDSEIRGWFNGPALLTWSRGQNEYGAGIAGPLPRSWMKSQWHLQKKILARYRQLGIVGQLPGFQGNMPVGIKALKQDSNISVQGATGWIDSLDPLYAEVADLWMKTLVADFGTDHWYQLDGYLNGGTAPWMDATAQSDLGRDSLLLRPLQPINPLLPVSLTAPAVRNRIDGDPAWKARGVAAYTGLNRTDPDAVWSFQGFAFVGWSTDEKAAWLKGFIDAVPEHHFNVIDMGYSGSGEWHKVCALDSPCHIGRCPPCCPLAHTSGGCVRWWQWNDSSFFDAKYVWTALMNFGGTNGNSLRRMSLLRDFSRSIGIGGGFACGHNAY